MVLKDKTYPARTISYKGRELQFKDYLITVDDRTGAELLATGEYEPVGDFAGNPQFSFHTSKWTKDRKLVLDIPIGYANGYGGSAMRMAEALGKQCDTYVLSNRWVGYSHEHVSAFLDSLIDKELDNIDSYYLQYYPAFNFQPLAKRQIGYTMLECTKWPTLWRDNIMRSCERLIVPCKAQKDAAINSGIDLDIEVIPLGIDPEMFPIIERKREDDGFLFGMEGTLTFRKGVDLGIKAFKLAFPKEKYPNVGFYLKSTPGIGRYYHKEAEDDERIIMTNEWFSPKELIDEFYAKIDSYVFLSRGEGMGMSTMQAMATGLPVIGSDCSGIQDHLNNNVGYLIPTTVVDVPNGTPFGYPPDLQVEGQQWWEADIEKAAEAMLDVYNNRDKANRKGKRAAEYIRRNFTADKQAERIIKYLDKKI